MRIFHIMCQPWKMAWSTLHGVDKLLQAPSEDLLQALGPTVTVFLSDVETDPWPAGNISALAAQSAR
jgi:hypothetical protein